MHGRVAKTLFIMSALVALSVTAFATQMQVRIYIDDPKQLLDVRQMHLDETFRQDNYIDIVTDNEELQRIEALGIRTEIVHDDIVKFLQSRLDVSKDMGGYMTLSEIEARMDDLIAQYPNIISPKISIGQSLEGRDIWAFKLSDNPTVDEDEPELLYNATHHAREVITPEVLFFFIDQMTSRYGVWPDETFLIDNREMWFIMVVNPDGYYHNEVIAPGGGGMWRKNRRDNGDGSFGVDPNRNYGYLWGYDDIGSSPIGEDETFRGAGPFSEPCIQALRDFIIDHDFQLVLNYHSYSNLLIWPWGYNLGEFTPDEAVFRAISDSVWTWNYYTGGSDALYTVNGGACDWDYGEQTLKNKCLGFTVEVGSQDDYFWPPLDRVYDLCYKNIEPNMFYARTAGNPYALIPPKEPVLYVPDVVDSSTYDINWVLDDTLNPAVNYELQELQNFQRITDPADNFDNWNNDGWSLTSTAHSSPTSFYSGSGYSLNVTLEMAEPIMVQPGDSIAFWANYDMAEGLDYAYVMISLDGLTYTPLEGNISSDYDPYGFNRGHGITGWTGSWVQGLFDLSDYVGQNVYVAFSYVSTQYFDNSPGIRIDDIDPVETYGVQTVISSSLTDTSYSFTNHPTGLYYYRVRALDIEDQWGRFSTVGPTDVINNYACVDSDGDGYGDPGNPTNTCSDDNCPSLFNPGQEDVDADGIGDVCDVCPNDPEDDIDADGHCADVDNCPTNYNPDQLDADGDGIGDLCDACPDDPENDIDGDGVCGDVDNCRYVENSDQEDSDGDLLGDVCDNCPNNYNPGQEDVDSDGIGDLCDNCPDIANEYQEDSDSDLTGDSCDVCPFDPDDDIDGDGICGDVDNCPDHYNPDQLDSDGDGVGDICCCVTRGDVDHQGGPSPIDIADLVYLVDFMFSGGDEPPCFDEGDIDGNAAPTIDISDLVYLVDYMFAGGPPPPACP
jgi:hypothetical protein